MNLLKDNTARAKQAISIFWIMLGLTIVNIATLVWQHIALSRALNDPVDVDMSWISISDTLHRVIAFSNLTIIILSMVFFIMWFRRAYYNLHQLPGHNGRYSEGWAAGSWFVPVISLWWPYQIMADIWKGIQHALRERLGEPGSAALVGWWWALLIITSVFNRAVFAFFSESGGIERFLFATKMDIIGEMISIPAILITIALIQRTNYFEKELLIHIETPEDSIFSDKYVSPQEDATPKFEN